MQSDNDNQQPDSDDDQLVLLPSRLSIAHFNNSFSSRISKIVNLPSNLRRDVVDNKLPLAYQQQDESSDEDDVLRPYDQQQLPPLKIPKFDENWKTPNTLPEAPDEIITYICSFLSYTDIMKTSGVSRKFRDCCSADELWKRESVRLGFEKALQNYNQYNTVHEQFVAHLTQRGQTRIRKTKYVGTFTRFHNIQIVYQALYGALCPILYALGILIHAILFPMLLDNTIPSTNANLRKTFIVYLITILPPYLVMASGLVSDPYFVNRLKQKYYDKCRDEDFIEDESFRRNYINGVTDHVSINASNLMVWGLGCIPLCIFCAYSKLILFNISYTTAMIPQYVLTGALLVVPVVVILGRHLIISMDGDGEWKPQESGYVFVIYTIVVVFNLIVSLQVGLLAAKLDKYAFVSTKYSLLFVPTWLLLSALVCVCPVGCCLSVLSENEEEKDVVLFSTACVACCVPCVILPIQIGFIIFSLLLDHVLSAYFTTIFIPFIIAGVIGCCCVACCSCCCFSNKVLTYTEQ